MAIGKPAALYTEKRPPTQSQIGKKLLLGIPICSGASNFEETTTTCLERSFPSMPALLNQFNISAELACVSSVLKLFEEITTKVLKGFKPSVILSKIIPSAGAKKCSLI